MTIMDEQWQRHIADVVACAVQGAASDIRQAAQHYEQPSAVYRPRVSVDGNQWCALYGDNLQDGVAGFGDSPADAMSDFDRNWYAKLPPTAANQALDVMMRRGQWPEFLERNK